jgi:hypothetical protein
VNGRSKRILSCAALLGAFLAVAPVARADDGDGKEGRVELRREVACSASSRVKLRARAEDGRIRLELEVDTRRNAASWTVVLLHERRIVFRSSRRTLPPSGSFEVRRVVDDWFGPDAVVARATGPAGETCRVSVTV